MRFQTFDDYTAVLSADTPYEFVEDWWRQLESEIRSVAGDLGYEYRNSVVEMITALGVHPTIDSEIIDELYRLRHFRNAVAHDVDARAPITDEARNYARRALALSWYLSELS